MPYHYITVVLQLIDLLLCCNRKMLKFSQLAPHPVLACVILISRIGTRRIKQDIEMVIIDIYANPLSLFANVYFDVVNRISPKFSRLTPNNDLHFIYLDIKVGNAHDWQSLQLVTVTHRLTKPPLVNHGLY